MPKDYIPRPDTELDTWALNLLGYLAIDPAQVGLTGADYDAIKVAWVDYHEALGAHTAAQAAISAQSM